MNNIYSLGAINKHTGEYVYPKIANKKDKYSCPDCRKDLILCQGKIKVHHFRHKVDMINPCHYYNKPSESQLHKDAKLLMKTLLDKKMPISFIRSCVQCKKKEEFEIPEISETSTIHNEYRFDYNGLKIADVAYIDNGDIVCIFEICNTHKTSEENRPEPWFEITASTLVDIANEPNLNSLQIPCIRCEKCDECIQQEKDYKIKKRKALIILDSWLENGEEIYPLQYRDFSGIETRDDPPDSGSSCGMSYILENRYDMVIYDKAYERYIINIVNTNKTNNSHELKLKCEEYNIDMLDINVDWILSQPKKPISLKIVNYTDFMCRFSDKDKTPVLNVECCKFIVQVK